MFNHTCLLHTCVCAGSRTPKWLSTARNCFTAGGFSSSLIPVQVCAKQVFTKNLKKLYLKIFLCYRRCRWHRWQTCIRDYLREFSKKSKWSQWHTQRPGGHWFSKKTWSRKFRQTPFNTQTSLRLLILYFGIITFWKSYVSKVLGLVMLRTKMKRSICSPTIGGMKTKRSICSSTI